MIKQLALMIGVCLCLSTYGQYDISVKINGLSCNDELLLANHFGDKQYIQDTSECENGVFHFRGNKTFTSGVYLVVLPKKNYFEILVSKDEDQTKYIFETDTTIKPDVTIAKGSLENELFLDFNRYALVQGKKANAIKVKMDSEEDEKKRGKILEELKEIGKGVAQKRKSIVDNNPSLFISTLYKAMENVEITDLPEGLDDDELKKYKFKYLRDHYWDNVDMSEDGLVKSPVFHNKIKAYFNSYMPPIPDTAIQMTDDLINKIENGGSSEQYKYAIHFLTNYFEDSKFLCFDKPLWHMAKNYYCAGKAFWADSAYVAKMCEESAKMEPILCDEVAPDMNMPDSNFKERIRMSAINKPVTVLVFWDINCGHCKKEMPIISRMYDSITNEHFEIYAIYTQGDWAGWKKRLAKEKYNFINVANAFGEDKFRDKYNIRSTPQIFVLDQDKKIRFKKIGAANIAETVQYLLEDQGIVEKKEPEDTDKKAKKKKKDKS